MEAGLPDQGLCIIREAKQKTWDKKEEDKTKPPPRTMARRGKKKRQSPGSRDIGAREYENPRGDVVQMHAWSRLCLAILPLSNEHNTIIIKIFVVFRLFLLRRSIQKIPTQTLGSISSFWAFHRSSWSALGHSPASGGKTGTIKPEFNLSLLFQKQKKRLGGLSYEARQDVTLRQICNQLSELEIFLACPQG
ncbi:predicted protein [Histoplasma capsulatum G186AR]|uniref:Uncharacterized protein n=1 Tax=Ajellomyces capsulatus (strain G186AR / H82 / ATCC MYA-2454 / RMSCC 2432) TaxID=447093 RepID=C0NVP8_AJECG|nr:uncharacterized protein HCBG_07228 [Histoplasma capsulatum G186AR]EEH04587.1 predicted protein [Histoplasma capsulatum G186AR]